jgi:hypothetical protein
VFSEGVQHRQRFCLDHLNCVKMAAFQLYLQSGKQLKVGWVGDDSHVVCRKKFPGEKGSVRWCFIMVQQPVLLSPKFGSNNHTVPVKQQNAKLTILTARMNYL